MVPETVDKLIRHPSPNFSSESRPESQTNGAINVLVLLDCSHVPLVLDVSPTLSSLMSFTFHFFFSLARLELSRPTLIALFLTFSA
jgi:hypothetical protein